MIKKQNHLLTKVSLKVLLINRGEEYLILKSNPKTTHFAGRYDLPGGRIDQDESLKNPHRLIKREIREELGGDVTYRLDPTPAAMGLYHFRRSNIRPKDSYTLYILFKATYVSGKIKLSDEHTDYQWLKLTPRVTKKMIHPALHQAIHNYFK